MGKLSAFNYMSANSLSLVSLSMADVLSIVVLNKDRTNKFIDELLSLS